MLINSSLNRFSKLSNPLPVGLFHAKKMAELCFLNVFRIGFPASLLGQLICLILTVFVKRPLTKLVGLLINLPQKSNDSGLMQVDSGISAVALSK